MNTKTAIIMHRTMKAIVTESNEENVCMIVNYTSIIASCPEFIWIMHHFRP